MHQHVTFEPYSYAGKPSPYHQQPSPHQEKGPLSPTLGYPVRNNYHYNYSPSNNVIHKQMNGSVQEPFYRTQEKGEFSRPQSNKEIREQYLAASRNQANFHIEPKSLHFIQGDSNSLVSKFSSSLFPNTSKTLNLEKFVQENIKLRRKLLTELQKIKEKKLSLKLKTIISHQHDKTKTSTRDTTPKRISKDKASTLMNQRQKTEVLPNFKHSQGISQEQQMAQLLEIKNQKQKQVQSQRINLQQLQKGNAQKRQLLQRIQSQVMNQSIHETPLLLEKQLSIQCLSVEIEWMNQKNTEIKRLLGNKSEQENMFEMYEKMCRQVERLRKENNKKSERLKKLFQKTNQLTNKEENANMFLMNLKV